MAEYGKVVEIDCETKVSTERDMTPQEIAEADQRAAEYAALQAEREAAEAAAAEAKASAESKLAALGLTADEIAALSK